MDQGDPPVSAPLLEVAAGELRAVVRAEWIRGWTKHLLSDFDKLRSPGRRVRLRRDATGAPTQRPECRGAAWAARARRHTFWR